MQHALVGVALGQFAEIEAGGEIRTGGVDEHGAGVGGEMGEGFVERGDDAVVEGVALFRPVDADDKHGAVALDL